MARPETVVYAEITETCVRNRTPQGAIAAAFDIVRPRFLADVEQYGVSSNHKWQLTLRRIHNDDSQDP